MLTKKYSASNLMPLFEKVSSLLLYAVVALEVIEFAKEKHNQLKSGTYKKPVEEVSHDEN